MLLSFSPTSPADYATGDHLRDHPDLIGFEVENYTPETHTYSMEESLNKQGEKRYELIIEEKPTPPENDSQKRQRIRQLIISAPDIAKVTLEGVVFSDQEKGEIISQAVYGGNIYTEIAESFTYSTIIDKAISARTAIEKTKLTEILARIAKKELIKNRLK